jgi:GTPase
MSDVRCGFAAVVGRPNVGKSTLINSIVGSKVSIVTAKPQTTRHRILAIHNVPGAQIVFVDTPGLHERTGKKAMNRLMNRTAVNALRDADVVLFLSEAGRWTPEDAAVLTRVGGSEVPVIAVLSKSDLVTPRDRLLEAIAATAKRHEFVDIVPVSARRHDNLDTLLALVAGYLPESPPMFPAEMRTDRGAAFHAAEIIREKLMLALHKEVPYGLTVQIERYETAEDRVTIHAIVWVERESQKGIVVGKGGGVLKRVGRAARLELNEALGRAVHVELWVKVKANWADSEQDLLRLGFDSP